ncbi:MAG: hypothetical protein AAFR58_06825 [Cyanobacteria bacterium J06627_28]
MKLRHVATGMILSLMAAVSIGSSAKAQTCTPLAVVEGNGETEVTKTVTLPGLLFIESNWDTDFAVEESYDYFVTTVTSLGGNPYDIDVFFKYPDESFDSAYGIRDISLAEDEPLVITSESRIGTDPYQINLRVGGLDAEGNTYTASVSGCR